jgi:hypothetical protein
MSRGHPCDPPAALRRLVLIFGCDDSVRGEIEYLMQNDFVADRNRLAREATKIKPHGIAAVEGEGH